MRAEIRRSTPSLDAGFTLIEVMIVIAIIALILAVGAPKLFDTKNQMRSAVRRMAIVTRDIRNIARLRNATVRLVLNMDPEHTHSYSVEIAPGTVPLLSKDQEEDLRKSTSIQRADEAPKSDFAPETSFVKKPVNLPRGLVIDSVEYGEKKEVVTTGKAYVHFFPQGLSQQVAIHLSNKKSLHWTIYINPLTGRADVFERQLTLKEIQQ